jgi:crossover junction endodeoxyribonuclease RuvC
MSRSRIGIDPGLTGAVALLEGDRAIRVWDMPVVSERRGKGVCAALLADILTEARDLSSDRPEVVLERVGARPGQGVTSMFSFGRAAGIAEGVVGALGLPLKSVTPDAWKRRARLVGKPKDAARTLAIELFPEIASELSRKRDGGRADALLLAYYGTEH